MNAGGDACYDATSVRFRWGVTAETSYGPCEIDEVPGFAVTAGTVSTVALTIHGDHLFFNGFPEGGDGGGTLVATGTPEDVAAVEASHTGHYLKDMLNPKRTAAE